MCSRTGPVGFLFQGPKKFWHFYSDGSFRAFLELPLRSIKQERVQQYEVALDRLLFLGIVCEI